jgi:hypothetical protein
MTTLMAVSHGMGLTRISIPFLLGTMLTPNRDRALAVGVGWHRDELSRVAATPTMTATVEVLVIGGCSIDNSIRQEAFTRSAQR